MARLMAYGVLSVFGMFLLTGLSTHANAMVVYEDVGFVHGIDANTNQFEIQEYGKYEAILTDFEFPTAIGTVGLAVTTSTTALGSIEDEGSFLFTAGPGTYYVSLFGQGQGTLDLGLYGVQIKYTAAPVPPSLLLLFSALAGFFWLNNRKLNLKGGFLLPRLPSGDHATV